MPAPSERNLNFAPNAGDGVQALMYVRFCVEKKYRVDEVATLMGLTPDTLYRYLRGDKALPARRLSALTTATGDPCYLDHIADQAGYLVVPKPDDQHGATGGRSLKDLEVAALLAMGRFLSAIAERSHDAGCTRQDVKAILERGTDVVRLVEAIRQLIQKQGGGT